MITSGHSLAFGAPGVPGTRGTLWLMGLVMSRLTTYARASYNTAMCETYQFFVGDKAYSVAGADIGKRQLEFVRNFDCDFYKRISAHLRRSYRRSKSTATKQVVAQTLRILHGQALEALFANIFATLQAPHCTVGWLQLYRPGDLEMMTNSVSEGLWKGPSLLRIEPNTWEGVSRALNAIGPASARRTSDHHDRFGVFWRYLATEYCKDIYRVEYNSLKHGLRTVPGGYRLLIGKEGDAGQPPSRMSAIAQSEVGSTFQRLVRLDESPRKSRVRALRRTRVNWDCDQIVNRLRLISLSLRNLNTAQSAFLSTKPIVGDVNVVSQNDVLQAQYNSTGSPYVDIDVSVRYDPSQEPDDDELKQLYETKHTLTVEELPQTPHRDHCSSNG
jgi:hypothetical protein